MLLTILIITGNLLLGQRITVTANVEVYDNENVTKWEAPDLPARFGKSIPEDGMWGHLVDIESNGCDIKTFKQPPEGAEMHWIALIRRGICQFDLKVLNAQKKKYYAAIIYNDESDNLIPMGGGDHSQDVYIPSVFIGRSDAEQFKRYQDFKKFTFWLDLHITINYWPLMKDFLIIASAAFAFGLFVGMAVLAIRWVRDVRRRRRSRLSTANLKKIPTKIFKKGDQYDICAICLDEYEDGDKLRILPCSHAYHQKCIDPWLTKNKKTCPICKRKVMPGNDNDSESDSDSDEENGTSENTPLLGTTVRSVSPSRTRGGTFDNSGLPAAVRSQVHPLSLSDSSDEDSYTTSNYQSSVEIHSSNTQRNNTGARITSSTINMEADTDSDETESADSVTSDQEDIILEPLTDDGATGGVDNPALVVIDDHFKEAVNNKVHTASDVQQTSADKPKDNVQVSVVTSSDNIDHEIDQIV